MAPQTQPTPSQTNTNARRMHLTLAYYLGFISLGLSTAAFGPTLPSLAEQTRTTIGQIGIVFTAQSTGYFLGTLQGGRIYDHVKGHPIMAICLLVVAAVMALIPTVPTLWLLIGAVFVIGFASGTLDVGGNTLLVWLFRSKVGPYMNGLHGAYGVGTFVAPIVVAQAILLTGGIAWAYWVLALMILPSAIWLANLPSSVSRSQGQQTPKKADRVLVLLIAAFFFINFGAESAYGGWLYTYAIKLGLATETTGAYLTSAFWGAFTVARLIAMLLSTKLRPMTYVALDMVGVVASVLVILTSRQSALALWIGTIGLGLCSASIVPTTLAIAERRLAMSGRVTSWFFAGGAVGGMTLPWLGGKLLEASGGPAHMTAIAVEFALAVIVFTAIAVVSARSRGDNHRVPTHG